MSLTRRPETMKKTKVLDLGSFSEETNREDREGLLLLAVNDLPDLNRPYGTR